MVHPVGILPFNAIVTALHLPTLRESLFSEHDEQIISGHLHRANTLTL
jgi:hypothetical protein